MPGPVSDSYQGPPICICGHFKHLHYVNHVEWNCQVDNCHCDEFDDEDDHLDEGDATEN